MTNATTNITILTDLTPSEQANSKARWVVFHLDMARDYLNREDWAKAGLSLRAARRSLRFVDLERVDDVSILRGILAMKTLTRRLSIEPTLRLEW